MDQRLERLEQIQKEMQEQMQAQMQEQLVKIQQDMTDKMMEYQRNMISQMTQMTQLLNGLMDKGKSPMINAEENTEYPQHPLADSGSNPGNNSNNPIVPDLDEIAEGERTKVELPKQLEDRCKRLEEKFKAIESADSCYEVDAKDLSLVPDLVLLYKFKMPGFEKYNGTSCPEAHITMFCRRMTGYINNDQLLIHCFHDNLVGAAAKCYNQLTRSQIGAWKDLAQAFIKQYSHVTDIAPDRITLQNMEKKTNESFRQYAQRWREVTTQVQPTLLEKETTMLFINTLKASFITHMLGSTTKSFSDIVMTREMIENAVKSGRIEAGKSDKRMATKKKENEVNNTNMGYSKLITVNQPKTVTTRYQGSLRRESGIRQNTEKLQFTPIPMTYKELYQSLFDAHVVSPPLPETDATSIPKMKYEPGSVLDNGTVEEIPIVFRAYLE
ncbi:Gag-pro-like protein [Gossypium australe]|uniref:Gag-pro-like protein n=1 Tax=Gossypium australe TaxID=47621 RepID=A0A5B6WNC8_9ROSI|nr:Gag-pro-like protein [Gossypium australe]